MKEGPKGLAFRNPTWVTKWTTSCLNLLDRLSLSSNRFVAEFERYSHVQDGKFILALPLGVLEAARDEYQRGFAIDYHLGVAATVFGDLLAQAQYLLEKSYFQAAAVLAGAALEEGLRSRARSEGIDLEGRETLNPLIEKLCKTGSLTAFEADRLKGVAKLRNDAAHAAGFEYGRNEVTAALNDVQATLAKLLNRAS